MTAGYAKKELKNRRGILFPGILLLQVFLQNSLYLNALQNFILMGREGKKPDQSTLACSLSACANLADLQVSKQLHEFILKSDYINDLFVSHAQIAMYTKGGIVESTEQMFKDN
ncbi:hypothetical protein KIW84_014018 [Lathyrus oleraceus]|uniref:Uncharacterized protein n=1 Tax=Pisum sativum TaxID=3888 RepID=A0A9D5BM29_PEA|nr:hypothetical protein KIW84_014018 [Pisum sativum]